MEKTTMVKEDQGLELGCTNRPRKTLGGFITPLVLPWLGLLFYGIGCGPQPGGQQGEKPPSRLFHDWPPPNQKPIFVLLLSGQQHGYLQPCGCSPIQYGGLERRYNLIQELKRKEWPIVAMDLGDIPQERGPQKLLKYVTSMESLELLGYTAVGMGKTEGALPFIDGLANFALNNQKGNKQLPPHVLAGNLQGRDPNFPGAEAVAFEERVKGVPRIGVTAVVAPSVEKQINDPTIKFVPLAQALPGLLKELQNGKSEFNVLLFQGDAQEAATLPPGFQVILQPSDEEEPPENPLWVNGSLLVNVGHKGRYVGLVGVYPGKPGKPFDLYYQLLRIGPEYKTPPGQDAANPILGELEKYARKVRDDNYLQMYSQTKHPIQIAFPNSKYVGSAACQKCHAFAFQVWQNSKHAKAFQTLVNAKRPSLREFDGECIQCHVVGFEYNTGYRNDKATPHLKDVGCESCHGPCSEHVDNKNRKPALLQLMNPFKAPPNETEEQKGIRMRQMHVFCQKCHDVDNDVGWNVPPVKAGEPPRRWHDIIHMTPKE
jgi:hypothetical protein